MKNLCKYALIATIILVLLFLLRGLSLFDVIKMPSWAPNCIAAFNNALFLGLFCGLLSVLAINSPLKKPTLFSAGGFGVFFISSLLYLYLSEVIFKKSSYDTITTWIAAAKVLDTVGTILIAIGLIWMAKYFTKGSLQQIASYILAIILVVGLGLSYAYSSIINGAKDPESAGRVYALIMLFLNFFSYVFFMFEFSKLKK